MPTAKNATNGLIACPRFGECSINICILDPEVNSRIKLPEENTCPFTMKKRTKEQKGMRLAAPDNIFKVIPESNKEMLNKGNLKRWHKLNGTKNTIQEG